MANSSSKKLLPQYNNKCEDFVQNGPHLHCYLLVAYKFDLLYQNLKIYYYESCCWRCYDSWYCRLSYFLEVNIFLHVLGFKVSRFGDRICLVQMKVGLHFTSDSFIVQGLGYGRSTIDFNRLKILLLLFWAFLERISDFSHQIHN